MWYQLWQGSQPGGEGKLCIRNHEEGNGKPSRFIFPRHDMSNDNGVNEAISQGLVELHSAWNGVMHLGRHPVKSTEFFATVDLWEFSWILSSARPNLR